MAYAPPTTPELRMAFRPAWQGTRVAQAVPVAGLPQDPTALALVFWAHWRTPVGKEKEAKRQLPDDVAEKLVPLLADADPAISNLAATVLILGHHQASATDLVAYLAYHVPRLLPLHVADRFGLAAIEPLTALILRDPDAEIRLEARQALYQIIEQQRKNKRKAPLPPTIQRSLVLLMLKGRDVGARNWAIYQSRELLPEKVREATCRAILKEGDARFAAAVHVAMLRPGVTPRRRTGPRTPTLTAGEIIERARSPLHAQRQRAAQQARTVWDGPIRGAMFELLADPDSRVQEAAAEALACHLAADKAVADGLAHLLEGASGAEQLGALQALVLPTPTGIAPLTPDHLLPVVRALATSPDSQIRLAVVQALRPRRYAQDRDLLQRLVSDPNRAVSKLAHAVLHARR